jgi:hypothetical protein
MLTFKLGEKGEVSEGLPAQTLRDIKADGPDGEVPLMPVPGKPGQMQVELAPFQILVGRLELASPEGAAP